MTTTETLVAIIVPIVVLLLLIAAGIWLFTRRRRHLQQRFGPEYERAVKSGEGKRSAERELHSREKRHRDLDIRELPEEDRERYAAEWRTTQERFVDQPGQSVDDADRLVTRVMKDRGYPTEDFDQQLKDLSVEHARTLEHYRDAHDISVRSEHGEATTEELRGAMVHYRSLFKELLGA
ncbi:hypothetical protein [Streptomyces sp. V3I7]|uniref:hypothetical protein n=1 Tax=Streptomyces sp. V3I7 TaxID=3042278 RepID=UPI0027884BFB|nr:hypothetical protein [Streptomyces sp. V3I7]MDQ0993787.1 hypothetical protein [Streptomyces sp. V3I7]